MTDDFDIVASLELLKHNDVVFNAALSLIGSFKVLDYDDYEGDVQDIIMAESFIDRTRFRQLLIDTYRHHAVTVLEEFMYEVDDTVSIYMLSRILSATVDLSNSTDHEQILPIIENNEDEPPLEILSEVLSTISDVTIGDVQDVIISVPMLLIKRLTARMVELKNRTIEEVVERNVEAIRGFVSKHPGCLAHRLIQSGVQPGNSLSFYFNTLDKKQPIDQLAIDLYSLLLMSNGVSLGGIEEVKAYISNEIYPDNVMKAIELTTAFMGVTGSEYK